MKMVSRSAWGAKAPKPGVVNTPAKSRTEFVVHHSGGPANQAVREIQNWCMDSRGYNDIDYNFLVGQDGQVYVGRGWQAVGSHATGHNTSAWGVCVIGDDQLSDAVKTSLRGLYAEAVKRAGHQLAQKVHSDVGQTDCPGGKIRAWVHGGHLDDGKAPAAARLLSLGNPYMRGDDVQAVQRKLGGLTADGIYGPHTAAAVERYQREHGLVADGIVGPKTRAKLGL